jgi:hypothetical protein
MTINWNRSRSRWRPAALLLALVLVVVVTARVALPAWADGCAEATRVFAVDSGTGHLMELSSCRRTPAVGPGVEVDSSDWRAYRQVTGFFDGDAAVLYAVTADGQLDWRRQPAPGAQFGSPARVASSIDWSRFNAVFAPAAGYLHAVRPGEPVHTFRHDGWATGAGPVNEVEPLLDTFVGPSMSAASWGSYGEANELGYHFRIWRGGASHDGVRKQSGDEWYDSGRLPAGITSVAGAEPNLYAVDAAGRVVQLGQPTPQPVPPRKVWDCPLQNSSAWSVVAGSPDAGYIRVVVPVSRSYAPPANLSPPQLGDDCDQSGQPYEWQ